MTRNGEAFSSSARSMWVRCRKGWHFDPGVHDELSELTRKRSQNHTGDIRVLSIQFLE